MIWNNLEFYTSQLGLELENGIAVPNSPIALCLGFTSLDSPALSDPQVKSFLKTFEKFLTRAYVEIDNPVGPITDLPGIFLTAGNGFSQQNVLDAINIHLSTPYTPFISDFFTLGFFPSREGSPVREITKDGKVYANGVQIATEHTSNPPQWALDLLSEAKNYGDFTYNHHKISTDGQTKKVYAKLLVAS